ncbi:metal ABC transporter ATP-binding protein [Paenibacillus sp. JX-17]|uniref:Metal ABC transporter ATP-binding protein n=1 Tax=Paenibacillus lacisoli TaxID=3064525 RepID=A0ABT9CDD5_9BACL|nr:metal ABC transporter ATP-binding protein [Paenibacillus sp. JX-17]MDO7905696.1 metal ABC transporter ATP-binding protein [Paenibacillus sp. JX-17]
MLVTSMRDVTFGYGDTPVVEQVSLDIHAGEFVGITGPNGAAKTTMIKLMLGLLKPWTGSVQLGQALKGKSAVGYVPQQVASFNSGFPSKVIELVRSGCYAKLGLFRRFTPEMDRLVETSLKQVGMWEYRDRRIGDLSGGQKQRICLARAFAQEPDVLVLDEPATGMDKESRMGLYELLRHNVTGHGRTVIMVTHSLEETGPFLDRLITLERKEQEGWQCLITNSCSAHFGPEA